MRLLKVILLIKFNNLENIFFIIISFIKNFLKYFYKWLNKLMIFIVVYVFFGGDFVFKVNFIKFVIG